jgi:YidC/Oxa1 family membrane protein insertase
LGEILAPLEWIVSWIMVTFHSGLTAIGMPAAGGWTWALSIVGLVIVMRILLIPLFVKQIRSQRGLQLLQPEIRKLQEKYKHDRERQSQEMMKLYRETGTNPFASCLPILAQAPIFFALFRVLNGIASDTPRGVLDDELVTQAGNATIFGAQISESFMGAEGTAAKVVAAVLIVLMSASTFITQKQLMSKNMPAAALEGPFAQQQKILLYVFPLIFAVTGVNFPIGVLIYWFTTNVWSMGQQFYVIHRMPAPGSLAEQNRQKRLAEKAARKGKPAADGAAGATGAGTTGTTQTAAEAAEAARQARQRQQPRKQARSKRKPTSGGRPGSPKPGAREGGGSGPTSTPS